MSFLSSRLRQAVLVVALALAWSGPTEAQSISPPPTEWISEHARDHALTGKIWSRERAHFVPHEDLIRALEATPFVLLGEVHDNADAHAWQGWVISQIKSLREQRAKSPPLAAVVFEHIRTDQKEALARFDGLGREARGVATTSDLFRLLDWSKSGWPSEDKFQGLFQSVLRDVAIYPANPPRERVRAVARGDASALSAEDRTRIKLDVSLDAPLSEALTAELKGSHCGMIPEAAIPSMSIAQRYRDAALADVMLTAASQHGAAILAAGNGHVRVDRAVPWYLRQRAPGQSAVSAMMLEVENAETDPASYVPRDPDGKPAADFVVFTPRAERSDPCESLRQPAQKKD